MSQENLNGEPDSMQGSSSLEDEWAGALAQQQDTPANPDNNQSAGHADDKEYQPAEFQSFQQDANVAAKDDTNLDMILEIPVSIALQISMGTVRVRAFPSRSTCGRPMRAARKWRAR